MAINEREHHIKVLERLLKETNGRIEFYSENKNIDLRKEKEIVEALGYVISSLKTDLKYDLLYEGKDVYTKDDVTAMLTELQLEISELKSYESADGQDLVMLADIGTYFDKKISELEGKNVIKEN